MKYDAIVVLGGGLRKDGRPTKVSRERASVAASAYLQGEAKYVVVSGGTTGLSDISEAESIGKYLTSLSVPKSAIIQERIEVYDWKCILHHEDGA